jgi:DNA-binding NarL/FixJ family response regulator
LAGKDQVFQDKTNRTARVQISESLQGEMKKTSVLLADKYPAMVEVIRDLLETLFDTIVMVSDEKSLIETLDRFVPDIIVVDLAFPVEGTQNVAYLLNRYNPELKFIVLSTHEGREIMESCKSSGASGYILKRSSAGNLIKAVEVVQNGGTFFSVDSEIQE